MEKKLCPFCTNGTSLPRKPLYKDPTNTIRIKGGRCILDNSQRLVNLNTFYYCPFCGRELDDMNINKRRFRGDKEYNIKIYNRNINKSDE